MKYRIGVLEKAELGRIAVEVVEREEVSANHGRKMNWFKDPKLKTAEQAISRRRRKFQQKAQVSFEDPSIEYEW